MNFRRVKAIGKKELIQVLRDPWSLMVVLLMPLMQMALLGYGVSLDVRHVPVCVFDREGSQRASRSSRLFQASIYFDIVETERNYNGVKRAMDAGRCKMAIVVPNDFSQDLVGANAASVQAILDASDDNTATIALGYAQAVVSSFCRNVQLEGTQSFGQQAPVTPTVVQDRVWFNEDLESRDFIIPGVVAMMLALVGAQLTSLTLSRGGTRHNGGAGVDAGDPRRADGWQDTAHYSSSACWMPLSALGLRCSGLKRRSAAPSGASPFDDRAVPDRRARDRVFHFGEHPQSS